MRGARLNTSYAASNRFEKDIKQAQGRSGAFSGLQAANQNPGTPLLRTSPPFALRYADIFSYARNQIRYHATGTQPEAQPQLRTEIQPSIETGRSVRRSIKREPVMRPQRSRRRLKELTSSTYHRLDQLDPELLAQDGRLRSLRRRVARFSGLNVLPRNVGPLKTGRARLEKTMYMFAILNRNASLQFKGRRDDSPIHHFHKLPAWINKLFRGVDFDQELLLERWMKSFNKSFRASEWHSILFFLLDKNPVQALQFIQILGHEHSAPSLEPYVLADALEHLAKVFLLQARKGVPHPDKSLFVPTFYHTLVPFLEISPKLCSQELLWDVAKLGTIEDLKTIFDVLVERGVEIGDRTLLSYAKRFGHFGEYEYALRCLRRSVEKWSPLLRDKFVHQPRFLRICAYILRKSIKDGQNYHEMSRIVAEYLRLGVQLTLTIFNVMMHNSMEAGDHTTAFRVYNLLKDKGLKPDQFTYVIMLRGCSMSENPGVFADFAEHCFRVAKQWQDPWISTCYLLYLYRLSKLSDNRKVDALAVEHKLFDVYSELFSLRPLASFPLPKGLYDFSSVEPQIVTLYIMFQVMIMRARSVSNKEVWELYQTFVGVVQDGNNTPIVELAKDPIIWNAFLYAFCQEDQFANASQLIKDMSNRIVEDVPQPNIYSWTIFMQSFFVTDQINAAERVYEIMQTRAIKPEQYTYGVLLKGYAKAQQIGKLAKILPLADNETQLDPQLLSLLARMHDRKKLMYELENARQTREREEEERQRIGKEEHEKRWARPNLAEFRNLLTSSSATSLGDGPPVAQKNPEVAKREGAPETNR
ncbi:hypothetical protein CC78DRAFT_540300 [Lojkania enalia]|uniref:Pentatricopeptide repeat protein n=1 Tax=Lojkania enalia TaxID=147567 RepID=A0A9P4N9V2_9PLEO|nr:hypothetical protein CC78DRAFT_540300 [Didymosphaeria enalia]